MKQTVAIVFAAAASIAAGTMAFGDNGATYYTLSNPRIIHVPQPGDDPRRSQASLHSNEPESFDDGDEADAAPRVVRPQPKANSKTNSKTQRAPQPSAHRNAPAEQRSKKAAAKETPPRRKPFSVSLPEPPPPPEPEPAGPKRALLSAPPPPPTSSIHDGPTPLRPTPRFGQPLPEPPAPLTTFTPPPMPAPAAKPVAAAAPAVEPAEPALALPLAVDDNDDHLPPPGDPKLAPPEPKD